MEDVKIDGRKIMVNGKPIFMKGVDWNPMPKDKGEKILPDGTFVSGVDYHGFVKQDAKLMQEAGINVVRVYTLLDDGYVLDILRAHGIYVLNTVYRGHENLNDYVERAMKIKDHPAILMWVIGNEWNDQNCYTGQTAHPTTAEECMGRIMTAVKEVKKGDPDRPVATVYARLPDQQTVNDLEGAGVEAWGINYYNWLSFDDLFEKFKAVSQKPMFMGEYGADAMDSRNQQECPKEQAEATTKLATEIVENSVFKGGVCSGGCIFEWSDEWWKDWQSPVGNHSKHGFNFDHPDGACPTFGPYPDKIYNEEWWGLVDLDRKPRPAYYAYKDVGFPDGA